MMRPLLLLLLLLFLMPTANAEKTSMRLEAEQGQLGNGLQVSTARPGYSGTGYVTGFTTESGLWTMTFHVPEAGHYDLAFSTAADAYRANMMLLNGQEIGIIYTSGMGSFETQVLESTWLEAGSNTLSLQVSWGGIDLDSIVVKPSGPIDSSWYEEIPAEPVNPEADDHARAIYSALRSIYGHQTLTGQYTATNTSNEIIAIYGLTGKRPALRGFDFMFCSPAAAWNVTYEIDRAMEWAQTGGLLTFCWHWFAPKGPSAFASGDSTFDLSAAVTDIDLSLLPLEEVASLYQQGVIAEEAYLLIRDIDVISGYLATMRDNNITILWRPLHEASGGWFWWGKQGPEPYLWLYRLMFQRQTYYHHLTNLLWVWNGQHEDWYVGDEYCDIVGIDIYAAPHSYTSQADAFLRMASIPGEHKLVAMTENGCVPDPGLMQRDQAMWLYYATWSGGFVANSYNRAVSTYTEREQLIRVYDNTDMITLENLHDYGF